MYMLQYDGLTMCRWLSQTGEVEECEVLHTLSTILGRVLSSVTSSEEDEARYTSIISELEPSIRSCISCIQHGQRLHGPFNRKLENAVALQEAEDCSELRLSPFHGHQVPHISMRDYVMRISRYSKCSNVCGVMAYSYLQRLAKVLLGAAHLCLDSLPALLISPSEALEIDMLIMTAWCAPVCRV